MLLLTSHIERALQAVPTASYRDAYLPALLHELRELNTDPARLQVFGRHVLALVSANLKASLHAEKALAAAKSRH